MTVPDSVCLYHNERNVPQDCSGSTSVNECHLITTLQAPRISQRATLEKALTSSGIVAKIM